MGRGKTTVEAQFDAVIGRRGANQADDSRDKTYPVISGSWQQIKEPEIKQYLVLRFPQAVDFEHSQIGWLESDMPPGVEFLLSYFQPSSDTVAIKGDKDYTYKGSQPLADIIGEQLGFMPGQVTPLTILERTDTEAVLQETL